MAGIEFAFNRSWISEKSVLHVGFGGHETRADGYPIVAHNGQAAQCAIRTNLYLSLGRFGDDCQAVKVIRVDRTGTADRNSSGA